MIQPEVRRLLERGGWTPTRRVRIKAAKARLESEGYATWPALLEFMAAFDRLRLDLDLPAGRSDAVFDVKGAIAETDSSWVEEYEARIAARLAPIGSAHHGHMVLLLADDGGFYAGFDEYLFHLGSDLGEALLSLLRGGPLPQID